MTTYEDAIAASDTLEKMGVSDYEVGIARIIRDMSNVSASKLRRKKGAVDKLMLDLPVLFKIAVDVYVGSAGASTTIDCANDVMSCYMRFGMNLDMVRKMAKSSQFAYLFSK